MNCGKLYKWTGTFTRDIPLPQIAREILACKSDKIYKYYKLRPRIYWDDSRKSTVHKVEFDVVIGCKDMEEAINIVARETKKDKKDIANDIELKMSFTNFRHPILTTWTKFPSQIVDIYTPAKAILRSGTSDIYKVDRGKNEFDVVVGAKSHKEAVNTVTSFGPLPFEEDESIDAQLDGPLGREKLEIVEIIHKENKSRVSLWK